MEKIAHIDGIAMEDYMYSQYKDIQFELAYLNGWRKQNLAEDYYNEKCPKATIQL